MAFLNPELFAAYVAAAIALILLPGPIVTLVIANSVAHGTRTGLVTAAGTTAGNALLVAVGALGLGALLAVVADLIHWVRWIGVAYLVYLGIREWRTALHAVRAEAAAAKPMRSARGVFGQGVLVAVTNPKTIFFYVAFFPQFLDTALPAGPQLLAMSAVFVVFAGLIDSLYAALAGRLRRFLTDPRRQRVRHGLTGSLFLATGLGIALARRG